MQVVGSQKKEEKKEITGDFFQATPTKTFAALVNRYKVKQWACTTDDQKGSKAKKL